MKRITFYRFMSTKYGAMDVVLRLDKGAIVFSFAPPFDPNLKASELQKGMRVYNYDKRGLFQLSYPEVLTLYTFLKTGDQDKIEFTHFSKDESKQYSKLTIQKGTYENKPTIAISYFSNKENSKLDKLFFPLGNQTPIFLNVVKTLYEQMLLLKTAYEIVMSLKRESQNTVKEPDEYFYNVTNEPEAAFQYGDEPDDEAPF